MTDASNTILLRMYSRDLGTGVESEGLSLRHVDCV
jgi:hypothetical protein